MNLKEKAKKIKSDIPVIFLCLKDTKTPIFAKILACITVAYALSPIDFIPDFIPVLGYLDDLIILPVLASLTIKMIPKEIVESKQEQARNMWKNGKPKKWYYAIPIVLIWIILIWMLIRYIFI